jgi:hypothetical protein
LILAHSAWKYLTGQSVELESFVEIHLKTPKKWCEVGRKLVNFSLTNIVIQNKNVSTYWNHTSHSPV